jgi:YVTN family beta-propeller protein
VTNAGSHNVSVIDSATRTVTATVRVGRIPLDVALTADGARAYVVNADSNSVSVIDRLAGRALEYGTYLNFGH